MLIEHADTESKLFAHRKGFPTPLDLIDAWDFLISHGSRIINYSGGQDHCYLTIMKCNRVTVALAEAVYKRFFDKPIARNTLFVFAAGETFGIDDSWSTPSGLSVAYDNIISVTDLNYSKTNLVGDSFSGGLLPRDRNTGKITVAAPGVLFETPYPPNSYSIYNEGTSFATPIVSGLAGLILSARPDATPSQVKQWIVEGSHLGGWQVKTAADHQAGDGVIQSFYAINAYESLLLATAPPPTNTASTIQLPKTGQTQCYDSAGTAIACSGTGQDGAIQAGVTWPNLRFTDKGDNTVLDNLTGLVWTKNANLPMKTGTWQQALDYVAGMNVGTYPNFGYQDWRLPNINELKSLIDSGQNAPALPIGNPFSNVQNYFY